MGCSTCGKSTPINNMGQGKILGSAPVKARMTSGSSAKNFGSPKVRISFASRGR